MGCYEYDNQTKPEDCEDYDEPKLKRKNSERSLLTQVGLISIVSMLGVVVLGAGFFVLTVTPVTSPTNTPQTTQNVSVSNSQSYEICSFQWTYFTDTDYDLPLTQALEAKGLSINNLQLNAYGEIKVCQSNGNSSQQNLVKEITPTIILNLDPTLTITDDIRGALVAEVIAVLALQGLPSITDVRVGFSDTSALWNASFTNAVAWIEEDRSAEELYELGATQ
jgi:hypothetical protein